MHFSMLLASADSPSFMIDAVEEMRNKVGIRMMQSEMLKLIFVMGGANADHGLAEGNK